MIHTYLRKPKNVDTVTIYPFVVERFGRRAALFFVTDGSFIAPSVPRYYSFPTTNPRRSVPLVSQSLSRAHQRSRRKPFSLPFRRNCRFVFGAIISSQEASNKPLTLSTVSTDRRVLPATGTKRVPLIHGSCRANHRDGLRTATSRMVPRPVVPPSRQPGIIVRPLAL